MRPWRLAAALMAVAMLPATVAAHERHGAAPATVFTTTDTSRNAYQQIVRAPAVDRRAVLTGRSLVRQTWVIAPSLDPDIAGLGPTYNRPACISCHLRNGRGAPPATRAEPMRSILVRLSIPGTTAQGAPLPEPAYGDQLNEFGVPGVSGEGEAYIDWEELTERLADGTEVPLRRPRLGFRKLAFGALHPQHQASLRVAPPIFGLGLLEAVPEADILAIAAEQRRAGQGIAGTPNRVWDIAAGKTVLGRFGWKANQPSVRQQVAAALAGDMGITSTLFPVPDCPPPQRACQAVRDSHPELSDAALDAMTLYHLVVAVPQRRNRADPRVRTGEQLFRDSGCASCHRPALRTGPFPQLPALAGQTIAPYTDLLLHDMGEGLADGRPDFLANGRQWRTPPLWGLGLLPTVNGHTALLHDGRARNALEAILWHGGEAIAAREAVRSMTTAEREALLAFLDSL